MLWLRASVRVGGSGTPSGGAPRSPLQFFGPRAAEVAPWLPARRTLHGKGRATGTCPWASASLAAASVAFTLGAPWGLPRRTLCEAPLRGQRAAAAAARPCVELALRGKTGKSNRLPGAPTVVFVHGLDSWSGTWKGTMEELGRRGVDCVAVDLRGHGLSPLGAPADFGPAQLAADVRAALLAAGVLCANEAACPNVVLVGHSMGGRIAMRYAADFPNDLAALVIEDMDCACKQYPADYLEPTAAEVERKRQFDRAFPSWDECRTALTSFCYGPQRVDGWRTEDPPRVFPRGPEGAVWTAINPYAQWLARRTVLTQGDSYAALQQIAASGASGSSDFPVHVLVAGPKETVCTWDTLPGGIWDMQSVLPGLVVTEFPEARHSIHNSSSSAFVDLLEKVLAACR